MTREGRGNHYANNNVMLTDLVNRDDELAQKLLKFYEDNFDIDIREPKQASKDL